MFRRQFLISSSVLTTQIATPIATVATSLLATKSASADTHEPAFEIRELNVPGRLSNLAMLLVPRHVPSNTRSPLLILLHGLGETTDSRLGANAWIDRYGLASAYRRLLAAPIAQMGRRADWNDGELASLNERLARDPFRGLTIVCPYMPNLKLGTRELDDYTAWLVDALVPRVQKEVPSVDIPGRIGIDGCSLGGHFSLEIFLRKPDFFKTWGGVQTAIGEGMATRFADRIARALATVGPRPLHIETSTLDPFRRGNEALSRALKRHSVAHDFQILPGPHDQPWLRESGTVAMLAWQGARLNG